MDQQGALGQRVPSSNTLGVPSGIKTLASYRKTKPLNPEFRAHSSEEIMEVIGLFKMARRMRFQLIMLTLYQRGGKRRASRFIWRQPYANIEIT